MPGTPNQVLQVVNRGAVICHLMISKSFMGDAGNAVVANADQAKVCIHKGKQHRHIMVVTGKW
jgi:hypothetical protein